LAELERLLRFQVPEAREVEAYIVRDKKGRILARTREELEESEREERGKREEEEKISS